MAVTFATGFEGRNAYVDGLGGGTTAYGSLVGTASYSTSTHRTGAAALRCNPA